MFMQSVVDDHREIVEIWYEPDGVMTVGSIGITKIQAYREYGQLGFVAWFAVFKGDVVWQRINGAFLAGVKYVD